ncbi:DUF1549 and DUF1553 domain-containing protein [Frigoriglobus tundricola]|uniref:DUF1549 domain-containing protein n=1 Tax=Frigoriglobus tundricola TaxID=2774151 RepID=A0A6M5Z1K3_9BACT|nr:DUF1549 and DUF1553 domain-containing protein [Frigoriglobus tundricola]QJW99965.1 hypothetical protein FTUN_7588 [Frigoriglobus tundricola]
MTRRPVPLAPLVLLVLVGRVPGQEKYADPALTPEQRKHWSFVPPERPAVPKSALPVTNPIDHFVRARLEKEGLRPAAQADKLTLARRVTLDLTGLPPAPAEVDAFLKDEAPDAYEKLVDRLLASPHFGERWATHWLDVVRFAETNGYEADAERPHAWRYRDYVVKSFNADTPYDRFVREQIAGDELADADGPPNPELLIATGMHRCGPVHRTSGNLDGDVIRQELLTEMVNGVGATFLGLTFACTRCHDHKFDPLSAGDYYRLQAFFGAAKYVDFDFSTPEERDARQKRVNEISAKIGPLKKQIADLDAPVRAAVGAAKRDKLEAKYKDALAVPHEKRTPEQRTLAAHAATLVKVSWDETLAAMTPADREKRTALREQVHALEARTPPPVPAAWAIRDAGERAKTHVLKLGDVNRKSIEVQPAFPRVLVRGEGAAPKTRRELAEWLTRADHPLTARVIVNRLWQHHFGRGIVATPNDFGTRGEAPTHPELLDWLACELVHPGGPTPWSLKHIHRLIVTSATYRQEATGDSGAKADPANKLLWKMNRRRLEAEAVRDSVLTAAGTLNRQIGGPSVKVPLEPEVYDLIFTEDEPDGLWPVTPDPKQHTRRSVYLFNKRNVRQPLLEAFDQPDTLNSCAARPVSTFAPQALILMNSPFVHAQAKALAVALTRDAGTDAAEQLTALYRRTVGRPPRASEHDLAVAFLKDQTESVRARLRAKQPIGIDPGALPPGTDLARVRALADLCVVLFNTHEFVYIP